ncbi:Ldh family oxidoreductase [Lachnospiraceae bacterium 54-53]
MNVSIPYLNTVMTDILTALKLPQKDIRTVVDLYIDASGRGVGHHDISCFPDRVEMLRRGEINPYPAMRKLSFFGGMESWDGDNGLGEVLCTHIMNRAVVQAQKHGMGFCTVRKSNHYLAGSPYVLLAARSGCIGIIMAKGLPTMGLPGTGKNVIGQSPVAFSFPTENSWPVLMDICLAYASGGKLAQKAEAGEEIPGWWGCTEKGEATTDPARLLRGIKYPIGEHKGFGLALLCELLTGVMSRGLILDEEENAPHAGLRSSSHTAIAIKTDALMKQEAYLERSGELLRRILGRSEQVRIPGKRAYEARKDRESKGTADVPEETMARLVRLKKELNETGGGK